MLKGGDNGSEHGFCEAGSERGRRENIRRGSVRSTGGEHRGAVDPAGGGRCRLAAT